MAATHVPKTAPDGHHHETSDDSAARAAARSSARLTPSQVSDLVKLAGSEIRQRGLAQVGIFRPLRVGTNQAAVERLIELALLDADPNKYAEVFSSTQPGAPSSSWVSESLAIGRPDAKRLFVKELAYAGVNDVAELIKWAYRHLQWGSQAFPVSWYTTFVDSERDSQYPLDAYTKLLLPMLSADARQLLEETFGLLSTVVAHHVANTMSAERMCKTFGLWLFKGADAGVNTAKDFQTFVRQWMRCTRQMEHLFLAYLRDQSSRLQYIPTRLTQLLQGYPVVSDDAELRAPGLYRVSTSSNKALLLSMEANSASRNQRRRSSRDPLRMLNDAIDATVKEGDLSPEADDWSSVVKLTGRANQGEAEVSDFGLLCEDSQNGLELSAALQMEEAQPRPTDDEVDGNSISRVRDILFEEDMRMLTVVSEELERRSKSGAASGDGVSTGGQLLSRPEDAQADQSAQWPRSLAPSLLDTDSFLQPHRGHRDPVQLSPVREDSSTSLAMDANSPNGWSAFEQTGFQGTSAEPQLSQPLKMSIDQVMEERRTLEPIASTRRRGSTTIGAIRRAASVGALRRSSSQNSALPTLPDTNGLYDDEKAEGAKINKISAIDFDEVLASVWQDTLLDDNAAPSLPDFVAVRLNAKAALRLISLGPEALETQSTTQDQRSSSRSPPSLLSTGSLGARSLPWLIVETPHEADSPAAANVPVQPKPKKPRHSFSAESRSALRLVGGGGGGEGSERQSRPFGRALSLRRSRTFNKQRQQDEARLSFGGSRTDIDQVSHGVGEADTASIDDRRSLFAPSVRSLKAKLAVPSALSRHKSVKRVSSAFGLRHDRGVQPPLPTMAAADLSGDPQNGVGPPEASTAPGFSATAELAKKSSANEQPSAGESGDVHLLASPASEAPSQSLHQTPGSSKAAAAATYGDEDAAAMSAASAVSNRAI